MKHLCKTCTHSGCDLHQKVEGFTECINGEIILGQYVKVCERYESNIVRGTPMFGEFDWERFCEDFDIGEEEKE